MQPYPSLMTQFADNDFKTITVSSDWTQGRTLFGGLVAALLFKAAKASINDQTRKIRHAQITFVGPVSPDVPVDIDVEILRAGGSTTSLICKAIQNNEVQTTMVASFAKDRDSSHQVSPFVSPPDYPEPESLKSMPYAKGITPEFIQHMDMKWAEGGLPFTNTPDITMGGWCAFKEGLENNDEAELLTLIDSWPPIAIQMLPSFAPVSTLNWNIQFLPEATTSCYKGNIQYQVKALQGAQGYSHTLAHLWNTSGELLAISTQTVAVFG